MAVKRIGKSNEQHVQDMNNAIAQGLDKGVKAIEAEAKLLVGVDTGLLRSSIESQVTQTSSGAIGTVGTDVDYAFFHALQNPYLSDAIDKNLEFVILSIVEGVSGL